MVKVSALRASVHDRPVRVAVPVQVSFAGESFSISEFTANLSVGGIFLPTDIYVDPGVEGELTFRACQWERPFTVRARVVRFVPPSEASKLAPGLGIQFIDLKGEIKRKLERLIEGVQDGSVVQSIRREIRDNGGDLLDKIRRRPVDQRLMLALLANAEEIDALIRDGNAAVVQRLLENPRLNVRHLRTISRDTRLPARTMMALRRQTGWFADEEVRCNYCSHPATPVGDVLNVLDTLPTTRLRAIAANGYVRDGVRTRARELAARRGNR